MFEVDRKGLRQLLERRGKAFALLELVQNAWDEDVHRVDITFTKDKGDRRAFIRVVDDNPNGFTDLRHAYTLFAPSAKKDNPQQRGRFNIGEKLVIALCEVSSIRTTTGAFEFVGNERRTLRGKNTERGSIFEGEMLMTRPEFDECCDAIRTILPPPGKKTFFNGEKIEPREPLKVVWNHPLRTEIADAEGYLRPTTRNTDVLIHTALPGEVGTLYEMGIPVVETGDDYHVDVQQKIPLNSDRDNVTPAYLRTIRTLVLNHISRDLTPETAAHTWVAAALESPDVDPDAVKDVIAKRFGDKAVVYDPSDPEANNRAVSAGFTVVPGGSFNRDIWANVRKSGALLPAGQVTPSPKVFEDGEQPYKILVPNATELGVIEGMLRLARVLLGVPIMAELVSTADMKTSAAYGGRRLILNKLRLGRGFFQNGISEGVVDLTLHEIGHEISGNHGSDEYNNALTRLGAKLAFLVKADPTLLDVQ